MHLSCLVTHMCQQGLVRFKPQRNPVKCLELPPYQTAFTVQILCSNRTLSVQYCPGAELAAALFSNQRGTQEQYVYVQALLRGRRWTIWTATCHVEAADMVSVHPPLVQVGNKRIWEDAELSLKMCAGCRTLACRIDLVFSLCSKVCGLNKNKTETRKRELPSEVRDRRFPCSW